MLNRFLENDWTVVATTRNPEKIKIASNLHILPYNIAMPLERERIIEYVTQHCSNGLDCLINNAGYGLAGPLEALNEEQIRQQFEVNFFAPLLLTRDLLPSLYKVKGKIINISSVLGFTGMPMQSLYAASKFALEGLSESLHYELAPHGIQVTLIEPGGFRTGFAEGMDWPTDPQAFPHYQRHFQGYQNFLKRVSKVRKGKNPSHVADVVYQLANRQSLPLRVRVGEDTHALYYLRRSLPQKIADRVLKRISRIILETR